MLNNMACRLDWDCDDFHWQCINLRFYGNGYKINVDGIISQFEYDLWDGNEVVSEGRNWDSAGGRRGKGDILWLGWEQPLLAIHFWLEIWCHSYYVWNDCVIYILMCVFYISVLDFRLKDAPLGDDNITIRIGSPGLLLEFQTRFLRREPI